ncbi:MAG: DUF3592 domain-containing protein [Planctomycetia bacterium]|nr:DUF3592 domain-containing protein [Planctomycetia bacterium]
MESEPNENDTSLHQESPGLLAGCVITFVSIFLIVWISTVAYFLYIANNYEKSWDWPRVEGKVLSHNISTYRSTSKNGNSNSSSTTYTPIVLYSYSVNREVFENDTVQFLKTYSSRSKAEKVLEEYPVDSAVIVFHNPDDPGDAVLVPGIDGNSRLVLNIFTGVTVLLIFLILLAWWKKRKSR